MIKPDIFKKTYDSGFKAQIILRPQFKQHFFGIIIDFGSSDEQELPGLAHFLEHKLFAKKDGDISTKFEELGASVNAFTSFNETMFYCSGIKNTIPLIELLFNLVGQPYFTKENVSKEVPIIQQELAMYQDEPDWNLGDNLMRQMFGNSNLAIDVAGTQESIAATNSEILTNIYEKNYIAPKMSFVACGDFSDNQIKTIFQKVNQLQSKYFQNGKVTVEKPLKLKKETNEIALVSGGSISLFSLGIALPNFKKVLSSQDTAQILLEIMLESKLGPTSFWFQEMRAQKHLNNPLQITVTYTRQGDFATIFGMSKEAELIIESIKKELSSKSILNDNNQVDMQQFFELQKKTCLAQSIRSLDDISDLAVEMAEESLDGEDLFENVANMQTLDYEKYRSYCLELLRDAKFYSARTIDEKEEK